MRLLPVYNKTSVFPAIITEELIVADAVLAVGHPLSHTPANIFGNATALLLAEAAHERNKEFPFGIQCENVLLIGEGSHRSDRQVHPVKIFSEGHEYTVPAGQEIILEPGQSLTLYPYCYHEFYVQSGTGYAIIGEVSMCNDDTTDNRFEVTQGRFPAIEEDEPAYRFLCNEYPTTRD